MSIKLDSSQNSLATAVKNTSVELRLPPRPAIEQAQQQIAKESINSLVMASHTPLHEERVKEITRVLSPEELRERLPAKVDASWNQTKGHLNSIDSAIKEIEKNDNSPEARERTAKLKELASSAYLASYLPVGIVRGEADSANPNRDIALAAVRLQQISTEVNNLLKNDKTLTDEQRTNLTGLFNRVASGASEIHQARRAAYPE